jgi:hypothetical protein
VLQANYRVRVQPGTAEIHLRKLRLSYQKPSYPAGECDPREIERFLEETFPRIQRPAYKLNAEVAFADASGIALHAHAGRSVTGRSPGVRVSG